MAIVYYEFGLGRMAAVEVQINTEEPIQCCRVMDSLGTDANSLMFFEPNRVLAEDELEGKLIDASLMKGAPVTLRFEHSAAILPIVRDLMIIYGDLVKSGK